MVLRELEQSRTDEIKCVVSRFGQPGAGILNCLAKKGY
jgi:hypothetical protein